MFTRMFLHKDNKFNINHCSYVLSGVDDVTSKLRYRSYLCVDLPNILLSYY